MKTRLLLAATLTTLSVSAFAADLPVRTVAPVGPATMSSWTGIYLGAQVGFAQSQSRLSGTDFLGHVYNPTWTSFLGGAHAGYDYQIGSYVVGLEGDVNARSGSGDFTFGYVAATNTGWQSKSSYDASVRARFGFLITNSALVYGTAGFALQGFKFDNPGCPTCSSWNERNLYGNNHAAGWTVGAGVQYAVTSAWSTNVQYRYSDYGTKKTEYYSNSDKAQLSDNRLEIGLTYKFGNPTALGFAK